MKRILLVVYTFALIFALVFITFSAFRTPELVTAASLNYKISCSPRVVSGASYLRVQNENGRTFHSLGRVPSCSSLHEDMGEALITYRAKDSLMFGLSLGDHEVMTVTDSLKRAKFIAIVSQIILGILLLSALHDLAKKSSRVGTKLG